MQLPGHLYDRLVRPKFLRKYFKKLYTNLLLEFDLRNKKILDFGCGTGAHCKLFDPAQYLGIDTAQDRIRLAQKNFPEYTFKKYSEKIPVEDSSLDVIVIISVLHHIPPEACRKLSGEFKRTLKKNGLLICIEPCTQRHTPFTNLLMKMLDRGSHIRSEKEYFEAFGGEFTMKTHSIFRKLFFNESLFSGQVA